MQAWGAALGGSGVGSVSKYVPVLRLYLVIRLQYDFVLIFGNRYCLSHSPVPVIVIRPESKVRKVLAKRKADPKRGKHFDE